ncbi:AtpZ/AtpI family protein [Fulvivirga lutimaris]|uniref:AtpZ/AtpI family protein n=1 Tax=Fulvivirga lutimaris TaxID=1819566 RepID=UPI0012BC4663|nr:AtpZ/AtpI family protein [Fulvivirga lutimaris]
MAKATPPSDPKESKPYNSIIKYSGLALQMGITIYLGSLLGGYLDERLENEASLYSKVITLLAVFLSIFSVIRQVLKDSND